MAMSRLDLPVIPWHQGVMSPQLDFIEGLTEYDPDFRNVTCRYFSDRFVYSIRGVRSATLRNALINLVTRIPGRGDYQDIVPVALHFGWLHHKKPFFAFSERTWTQRNRRVEPVLAKVG